jgi:rhamnogalacturonyl hydrolase YesR
MTILDAAQTFWHRVRRQSIERDENERLAPLYDPDPGNTDRQQHIEEAVAWLKRAQDAGTDRGVSYGVRFGGEFQPSYPETTGYICRTFVAMEKRTGEADFLRRAQEMADWEIAVQLPEGAVMGGMLKPNPTPAVFNTGMVLLGWSSLIERTAQERYKLAARKAADWLLQMQEPNGDWVRGNSDFAVPGATLYNVKAAWGLCEAGAVLGEDRYISAAVRNAEYCVSQQRPNGWFPNCCLSDPTQPLLHTLAYTLQGLLGISKRADRADLLAPVEKTARAQIALMTADGFIPGRQDADLRGTVSWSCLTGSAQMSVVWSDLYDRTGQEAYREAAQRVNRYLMTRHDIRNSDPRLRGGLAGSWPVWGDYGRLMVLNWATKFLIDALVQEPS